MTKKTKMMLFGIGFAVVVGLLIVALILLLGSKPTGDQGSSDAASVTTSVSAESVGHESEDTQSNISIAIGETSLPEQSSAGISSRETSGAKVSSGGSVSLVKPSSGSSSASASSGNSKTFNILVDPTFEGGFNVLGMNVSDSGSSGRFVYNPLDSDGRQYWNLAQWGTKYSFADSKYTQQKKLGSHIYGLININKEFIIDYSKNMLTFTGITSKLYDGPRTSGDWHHLLIEQKFKTADTKISNLNKVQVTMSNRLTYFKDNMGDAFNPNIHAAQFLMYFMVANVDNSSKDYNNFIWFGFPLFDNRFGDTYYSQNYGGHEWNPPGSMLDKGTNRLMVSLGNEVLYKANNKNNCFKNGRVNASAHAEWSYFSLDVLPHIKEALTTAKSQGYMKNTSLEQLAITGMNLGWEIPGSFDVTMEVKDFSVMATRK